jgi:hypothetical protein
MKLDLKGIGFEDVERIQLARIGGMWRVFVNTVMYIPVL